MSRAQLIGTWKLFSAEFHTNEGKAVYLWGKQPAGLLIYTSEGYVSAQIMNPDRLKFVSRDNLKGSPEETKTAFDGYQAYYGKYEVDEAEKTVVHHIEGNLFPNAAGIDLKRYYQISGNNILTLTTPQMTMGGEKMTGTLMWERIG